MIKLIAVLVSLALIALLCVVVYTLVTKGVGGVEAWFRKRERTHGKWEIEESKGEDGVEVYVVEPGTGRKQLVETTDQYDQLLTCARWGGDFEFELEILRRAAAERTKALNDRSLIR
jgi:hypothetical protein